MSLVILIIGLPSLFGSLVLVLIFNFFFFNYFGYIMSLPN